MERPRPAVPGYAVAVESLPAERGLAVAEESESVAAAASTTPAGAAAGTALAAAEDWPLSITPPPLSLPPVRIRDLPTPAVLSRCSTAHRRTLWPEDSPGERDL